MTKRAKLLNFLAKILSVPAYFEILPITEEDFEHYSNKFKVESIPGYFSRKRMDEAMCPKPAVDYRVFLQLDGIKNART